MLLDVLDDVVESIAAYALSFFHLKRLTLEMLLRGRNCLNFAWLFWGLVVGWGNRVRWWWMALLFIYLGVIHFSFRWFLIDSRSIFILFFSTSHLIRFLRWMIGLSCLCKLLGHISLFGLWVHHLLHFYFTLVLLYWDYRFFLPLLCLTLKLLSNGWDVGFFLRKCAGLGRNVDVNGTFFGIFICVLYVLAFIGLINMELVFLECNMVLLYYIYLYLICFQRCKAFILASNRQFTLLVTCLRASTKVVFMLSQEYLLHR